MSATPAASYLMEFGRDGGMAPPRRAADGAVADPGDTASRIEAAHASGFDSGRAAAMAALEARLEEERAASARQLAAARQAWAAQEGERLALQLSAGLDELQARLSEATARVLEPFLRAELRRQAIASLGLELEALLARDPGIGISVTGPEDLLEALRDRLSGTACAATYLTSGEPDVRILAGETILETRLAAWAAKIEEAVG
jgi:hypothetical protein